MWLKMLFQIKTNSSKGARQLIYLAEILRDIDHLSLFLCICISLSVCLYVHKHMYTYIRLRLCRIFYMIYHIVCARCALPILSCAIHLPIAPHSRMRGLPPPPRSHSYRDLAVHYLHDQHLDNVEIELEYCHEHATQLTWRLHLIGIK